jgi:hypothetical protein
LLGGAVENFTLSNLLGAILVLVGLWLVVTGAPQVVTPAGDGGLWPILKDIFTKYPRVAIGIVLIILGGVFLGVDFGPVLGGSSSTPTPTPSLTPTPTAT